MVITMITAKKVEMVGSGIDTIDVKLNPGTSRYTQETTAYSIIKDL